MINVCPSFPVFRLLRCTASKIIQCLLIIQMIQWKPSILTCIFSDPQANKISLSNSNLFLSSWMIQERNECFFRNKSINRVVVFIRERIKGCRTPMDADYQPRTPHGINKRRHLTLLNNQKQKSECERWLSPRAWILREAQHPQRHRGGCYLS